MATETLPAPSTALTPAASFETVRDLLRKSEASLAAALPSGIPVSYMIRVVLTVVQRNPELLECYPLSLLGAVFQAAQLGLVPDGVLGQAYLVPFRNTRKNRKEVQFIPGYRGLITLVRRTGDLSTIDADVVRAKDRFLYTRGTSPTLEHVPYEGDGEAGELVKVWAIAKLKDGGYQIKVMNKREVDAIKARSASVRAKRESPWDTDPEWMWKKTCLKQLCKLLPVSVETQRAMALDDKAEVGLPQDLSMLADEREAPTPIETDAVDEPIHPAQRVSQQPTAPVVNVTLEPVKPAALPTVGIITEVKHMSGGARITLETGYACASRSPELIKAAEGHRDAKLRVELVTAASSDPSRFLPVLTEIQVPAQ